VARANPLMRSKSVLALESRVLFDGAMLATAIEQDSAPPAPEIPEVEADEPAEPVAEAPAPAAEPASPLVVAADAPAEEPEEASADPDADTTEASDTTAPQAVEPAAATGQEIVFVDGRVTDPAAFQSEGREVIVLALDQDGMSQIASALAGRTGIDAIHIVSHGSDGLLTLGSTEVTAASIQSTQLAYLQSIGQALSADGDILIYACDYASGASGLEAMNLLADITSADVAASTDATGHESLGADWTLEQSTGEIDAQALAPLAWMNALDFTFTGAGTVGAVGMANNIMGAGVTVVSATYQGGATQSGTFASGSGVTFGSNVLGFTSGTILSTGSNAAGVAGPNNNGGYGDNAPGVDGDAALNAMAGNPTFDAAILNISFVPDVPPGGSVGDIGRMTLEIVFGSEEYVEYVGQMNDVMEVTVNGTVVSLVPNASGGDSTIGINSVNTTANPSLFINNTGATYNTQMDAFTITIPMAFDVIVGQTNTIRLAVADAVDDAYDSWLFVRADSGQTVVVAEDDEVTTAANLPITVDLTANDYSLAGGSMSLTHIQGQAVTQGQVITLGSGIQLTVGSGGQVTVTGNGSSAANDTFTYQVSNGMGGVASATVNVEVTAPNLNPPVAQDDVEAVLADATLSDSVLTNNGNGADTDPNGNPLSVVQVNLSGFTAGTPFALPSGALLTMNANGTYVYDPNGAFAGLAGGATTTDSFSYTVTDGQGGNDTATVTITVTGVASNHDPVATDDSFTINEDGVSTLGDLLANDSDADGDALTLVLDAWTGSNGGEISGDDSGNLYFIPGAAFDDLAVGQSRNTSFTYTLWDAQGASDTATVTITVQGANDAPVGVDDAYDADEDGAFSLGNPVANDTDPDSSWLYMSLNGLTGTNGGSFSTDDSGNLIFIAGTDFDDLNEGESRQTSYTYTVNDAEGAQAAATVLVTVHGANDAPVGGDDVFTVLEDGQVSLGILTDNDLDVDSDEIFVDTSAVIAGDNGGVFSFDDSGNLSFDPDGDFNHLGDGESASTRFYYTLFDGEGASSMATVTVNVLGVNDAPVAQDDSFAGFEDSALSLGSVLANDSDVEGDVLTMGIADVAGSGGGRFVVDGSMNLTFDPNGEFEDLQVGETRETSFTYAISDGHGGSAQAVVTVTVEGANDAPDAQDDHFDVDNQAATSLGSLLLNDTDVDGDELSQGQVQVGNGSNGGIFGIDDSGCLSFDPAGAFDDLALGDTRDTSFSYTISDGQGGLSSATVTVTVHGAESINVQQFAMFEAPSTPNEVVFVDARVPDPQAFAIGGRELVVLTLDEDGLAQMAAVLAGRTGVEAIHIVSHGGDGYLTLGSGNIDANSFQASNLPSLDALAQALSVNGDILIYACDFASGAEGQNTLQLLAQYTLADVAASLGTTGHETLDGNWTLEATVGSVEAVALAPEGWVHTLNLGGATVAQAAGEAVAASPSVDAAAAQTVAAAAVEVAAPAGASPVVRPSVSVDTAGFGSLGAARVVSLEDVFRQTLTPFMTRFSEQAVSGVAGTDQPWSLSGIDTGIDTGTGTETLAATTLAQPEGWLPTLESLDDSLVDEAATEADPLELQQADVDALQAPRQQAAPGFAAQLARWSQWTTQRPLTRAVARA
jgi:VCBS repeat-containing protein